MLEGYYMKSSVERMGMVQGEHIGAGEIEANAQNH
jgi:hypothetical protein